MKPTIVNHSLRTIKLAYNDNGSPLCPYEEKLLFDYLSLHNRLHELLSQCPKWITDFEEIDSRCEKMKIECNEFNELYENLKKPTDIMMEKNKIVKEPFETFQKALPEFNKIKVVFQEKLHRFIDDVVELSKKCKEYVKQIEDFSDKEEEFGEYTSVLYKNYDSYQIELIEFDDDYDNFHADCDTLIMKERMKINKLRKSVIERYNAFHKDVTELFDAIQKWQDKWNDFFRKALFDGNFVSLN